MPKPKRIVLFSVTIIACLTLLTGCMEPEKRTPVEEKLIDLEFTQSKVALEKSPTYIITTEAKTIIWKDSDTTYGVEIIASKDGSNTITYDQNEKGEMFERKIHLSPDSIKKYSKAYVNQFGDNLKLKHSEQDKD